MILGALLLCHGCLGQEVYSQAGWEGIDIIQEDYPLRRELADGDIGGLCFPHQQEPWEHQTYLELTRSCAKPELELLLSPSCHYLPGCACVRQAETCLRSCTFPMMQNSSASFAVAAALGICGNDSLPLTISISGTSDNTNCTISQSLSDDGSVSCASEGYVRLWSNFYCFLPLPLPSSSFLQRSKHYYVLIPGSYRHHNSRTKCYGTCSVFLDRFVGRASRLLAK